MQNLVFKSHNWPFLVSRINIRLCIDSAGLFKRIIGILLWRCKGNCESGIGVIGLKLGNLFEDVVGVCDIEKGTGEVTMLFTGVLKISSYLLSLLCHH